MKPLNVDVTDIKYRRPGLVKVEFAAEYDKFIRHGTMVYNTLTQKFVTHTSEVDLLAAICLSLQQPRNQKDFRVRPLKLLTGMVMRLWQLALSPGLSKKLKYSQVCLQ